MDEGLENQSIQSFFLYYINVHTHTRARTHAHIHKPFVTQN